MIDIIIPTCKTIDSIKNQIDEIDSATPEEHRIISTCKEVSASQNRNAGLSSAMTGIVIMMDDDMTQFYDGWLTQLIEPMTTSEEIVLMSVRLMHPKSFSHMGVKKNKQGGNYKAKNDRVATACFALRRDIILQHGISFDENFKGSGYEDTDFMQQINQKLGTGRIWVNDDVELLHNNEMKNQGGPTWQHNHDYYRSKWPEDQAVVGQTDWTAWR